MARDFINALDLGSHTFRMIAARPEPEAPDGIEVLAAVSVPASGIRRGAIISIEDVAHSVAALRSELERQVGSAITHSYVGVGGPHVTSLPSRGLVVVSRPDNRIGSDDIRRVLEAAGAISFGQNTDVLNVLPREFIVDGERGVKDPEGMQGRRLEVEAVVLTSASQHIKNLKQALSLSDVDEHELILNPVATSRAVLTPRQKELGVAVIDIGHGTTDIAVFEDGQLLAISIIPIGGSHITNDIAIGLRCSIDAAEAVKHEYGTANAAEVSKREQIEMSKLDPLQKDATFSRRDLAEIIDARLEEIFELVGEELKRIERWRLLPAGIILTGGTANIPGIVDSARRIFKLPVQLGYPIAMAGPKNVVSEFSYVTTLGIIFAAVDTMGAHKHKGFGLPGFPGGAVSGRIKKVFRSILP